MTNIYSIQANLARAFENDPYISMFNENVQAKIVTVFAPALLDHTVKAAHTLARVVEVLPLGFVTPEFKKHLVDVALSTVEPETHTSNMNTIAQRLNQA